MNKGIIFIIFCLLSISCVKQHEEVIPVHGITNRMMLKFEEESRSLNRADYRGLGNNNQYYEQPGSGFYPIGGVVSHHSLVGSLIYNYFSQLADKCDTIKTIIIIGPDHFLRTYDGIALGTRDYSWYGKKVSVNRSISDQWIEKLNLENDYFPFYSEHTVNTLIPFIARFFPEARVIPVILKPHADIVKLAQLADLMKEYLCKNLYNVLLLISTDFCHNLSRQETDAKDMINLKILSDLKKGYPYRLTCDSQGAWYVALSALNDFEKKVQILFHTDNEKFLKFPVDSITSYFFSIIYIAKYVNMKTKIF